MVVQFVSFHGGNKKMISSFIQNNTVLVCCFFVRFSYVKSTGKVLVFFCTIDDVMWRVLFTTPQMQPHLHKWFNYERYWNITVVLSREKIGCPKQVWTLCGVYTT